METGKLHSIKAKEITEEEERTVMGGIIIRKIKKNDRSARPAVRFSPERKRECLH